MFKMDLYAISKTINQKVLRVRLLGTGGRDLDANREDHGKDEGRLLGPHGVCPTSTHAFFASLTSPFPHDGKVNSRVNHHIEVEKDMYNDFLSVAMCRGDGGYVSWRRRDGDLCRNQVDNGIDSGARAARRDGRGL